MSGKVAKVLNVLVFSPFFGFVGWLILVYLGLEGLGVFVVLVFVFFLFRFCFVLLRFVVGLFLVLFWFCFCCFPCFY